MKSKMRVRTFHLPFKKNLKILIFKDVTPDNYREVLKEIPRGARFAIPVHLEFTNQNKIIEFDSIEELPQAFRKMKRLIKNCTPIPALHYFEGCHLIVFLPAEEGESK